MHRDGKHITPNQLRNFRKEAGLNQSEVAFLLDIKNSGRISDWENGKSNPSIEHLIGLSLIYHRLESQTYYELRKRIAKKIETRKKLLLKIKGRDNGG